MKQDDERKTALRDKDVGLGSLGIGFWSPHSPSFLLHEPPKSTKMHELMCLDFEKRFDVVSTYVHISHPHNLLFPALIKCRFTGVMALPSNNAPKVFL